MLWEGGQKFRILASVVFYSPAKFSIHIKHKKLEQINVNTPGLLWWLSSKDSACNAGEAVSIPGLRRSPVEGNGNPRQYSCLENPMDRGACWVTVPEVMI